MGCVLGGSNHIDAAGQSELEFLPVVFRESEDIFLVD